MPFLPPDPLTSLGMNYSKMTILFIYLWNLECSWVRGLSFHCNQNGSINHANLLTCCGKNICFSEPVRKDFPRSALCTSRFRMSTNNSGLMVSKRHRVRTNAHHHLPPRGHIGISHVDLLVSCHNCCVEVGFEFCRHHFLPQYSYYQGKSLL